MSAMHEYPLRYVSLSIFIYLQTTTFSRTCDLEFTDVSSKTVLADLVVEARAHRMPPPKGSREVPVRFKVNEVLKGQLDKVGNGYETITVGLFGGKPDRVRCVAPLPSLGSRYVLFLRSTGIHLDGTQPSSEGEPNQSSIYRISSFPEPVSDQLISEVRLSANPKYARKPRARLLSAESLLLREMGQAVRLQCVVSGRPRPTVTWYKDDLILPSSKRVTFLDTKRGSTLVIRRVAPSDSGVYRCRGSNAVGTTSLKTQDGLQLTVLEQPKPSEKPHAKPCETQDFCLNGGKCYILITLNKTFCECPYHYVGDRCQEKRTGITDALMVLGKASKRRRRLIPLLYLI